jgi:sterol desaturase/sphingolipid hydroxylase (fatty acid hydroxylase superfamily)
MATKATGQPSASRFVGWVIFAAILAAGAAAAVAEPLFNALADASAVAAARDGLVRLAHGDLLLKAGELRGLALLGLAAIGVPLGLVGMMWLIERCAGPRDRGPKNYWLAWQVQALFLGAAALLEYATTKIGPLPWRPLIQVGAEDGLAAMMLRTVPAFLLATFAGDFCAYWFHRAQHRFAILWRFHAVHHAPRDLDVLHNFFHPVELIGNVFFVALPTTLLIGMNFGGLYFLIVLFVVQGYIHHMNVPMHYGPLRHLLADNRYHFVHHSLDPGDYDTNFATFFPVFDRLFGTYRKPSPGPLPATGLPGAPPSRLSHYLLAKWPEPDAGGAGR